MLPFYFGLLIPFTIFALRAAMEIKTIIKHRRDSNGDSIFKAVHYTGLIIFSKKKKKKKKKFKISKKLFS